MNPGVYITVISTIGVGIIFGITEIIFYEQKPRKIKKFTRTLLARGIRPPKPSEDEAPPT